MSTTATPCRAKNPDTCKYHGPERRAAEAAARGDWDAVLTLLLQRDANKGVLDEEMAAFQTEFGLTDSQVAPQLDLYAMTEKQKIAYLEDQILEKDIKFPQYGYRDDAQMVDVAVHLVAKYTPADTVFDIAKAEGDYEWDFERFFEDSLGRYTRQVTELWQDTPALLAAPRNLLVPPVAAGSWRDGFKHELAKALAERGELMQDRASTYGWKDYDYIFNANRDKPREEYNGRPYQVVSVLHVVEDQWSEFEGTFTENSEHVGVSGWGVLADGTVHRLRLEEEFGSLLRSITRG